VMKMIYKFSILHRTNFDTTIEDQRMSNNNIA